MGWCGRGPPGTDYSGGNRSRHGDQEEAGTLEEREAVTQRGEAYSQAGECGRPQPGQEARQHSREGRCQPLVTPSLPPTSAAAAASATPSGVFPNCQLARVLQGKARTGQQGRRTLKSVHWEQSCCSHTQLASSFAGNFETLRFSSSSCSSSHQHLGVRLTERKAVWCGTAFIISVECARTMQNKSPQMLTENYQGVRGLVPSSEVRMSALEPRM